MSCGRDLDFATDERLTIAFNDVAEHDVYWGKEKATGYAHGRGSGQKQYIVRHAPVRLLLEIDLPSCRWG